MKFNCVVFLICVIAMFFNAFIGNIAMTIALGFDSIILLFLIFFNLINF